MENSSENKPIKHRKYISVGVLAHVDAGKTTLSEAMLFQCGAIHRLGRVDNQDAFLDTHTLERERGITIFAKQAVLTLEDMSVTLLDTPGHADFSAEMERTLQVMDYAVLVISGADGVQGHTLTLWYLLKKYRIPVFIFINKMDQPGTDRQMLLQELQERLGGGCMDFGMPYTEAFWENAAMGSEAALEEYLEQGKVTLQELRRLIRERELFPCYFGSALKQEGVRELLGGMQEYICSLEYPESFGARVFKIARDGQGNRLTYLKITGGSLKVKDVLTNRSGREEEAWEEKVNQIRIYSGEKYEAAQEAGSGVICAVTGLSSTYPGQGLGREAGVIMPILEPVLSYRIQLPEGCDAAVMLPKLRQLEEEDPQLHLVWLEGPQEIHAQVMGEVQTEVLRRLIADRFATQVSFDKGSIVYKETIADRVEGVGHYEPLRHYAEVHLLLEPGEPGSGLTFSSACREEELDRSWQRLILTHLREKEHKGVLTGSAITDMKITLTAGRAHLKHTEGGDFRQATYRAVRQGLMEAQPVLLEPYYEYRLEVPEKMLGRAMTDIERMHGSFAAPEQSGGMAVLAGSAPVACMREYQREVMGYTKGCGRLACTLKGYESCHNAEEVIQSIGYDADRDPENPSGSVFCAHGAGFVVEWDRVKEYMHVEGSLSGLRPEGGERADTEGAGAAALRRKRENEEKAWLGTEEVDAILQKAVYANGRQKDNASRRGYKRERTGSRIITPSGGGEPAGDMGGQAGRAGNKTDNQTGKKEMPREDYLLVDGYNIIFAWDDLKELAQVSIDGARGRLMDILCNYQSIRRCSLIVVFDAYRVQGHETESIQYHNIKAVYTREAETADRYIERFAHEHGRKYRITVATSDGLEQIIIRGQGCRLISARELREEVRLANEQFLEAYEESRDKSGGKSFLLDNLEDGLAEWMDRIRPGAE